MARKALTAILAVSTPVALVAGCFVDLVDPAPDQPVRASVLVSIEDADVLSITIVVGLNAGTDGNGQIREISDLTISVAGVAIGPRSNPRPGVYDYLLESTYEPAVPRPTEIEIVLPSPGPGEIPLKVTVPMVYRDGPYQLVLEGSDIELILAPLTLHVAPIEMWILELAAACPSARTPDPAIRPYLTIRTTGWSGRIRLSRELLGSDVPSTFAACLRYGRRLNVDSGEYSLGVTVNGLHMWHVQESQ